MSGCNPDVNMSTENTADNTIETKTTTENTIETKAAQRKPGEVQCYICQQYKPKKDFISQDNLYVCLGVCHTQHKDKKLQEKKLQEEKNKNCTKSRFSNFAGGGCC